MKRLIVGIIAVIVVLVCVFFILHAQIRNIYDEMYYSYTSSIPQLYTNASFYRFGLKNINNDMRYIDENTTVEYLATNLLQEKEMLMIQWDTRNNNIQYSYITPSNNPGTNYILDVIYSTRDHTLTYEPLRLTSSVQYASDFISEDEERNSIKEYLLFHFNELIPYRWLTENGDRSHFTENNMGNIVIIDKIWNNEQTGDTAE